MTRAGQPLLDGLPAALDRLVDREGITPALPGAHPVQIVLSLATRAQSRAPHGKGCACPDCWAAWAQRQFGLDAGPAAPDVPWHGVTTLGRHPPGCPCTSCWFARHAEAGLPRLVPYEPQRVELPDQLPTSVVICTDCRLFTLPVDRLGEQCAVCGRYVQHVGHERQVQAADGMDALVLAMVAVGSAACADARLGSQPDVLALSVPVGGDGGPVSMTTYSCATCGQLPPVPTPAADDPIRTCWKCCTGPITQVSVTPGRVAEPFGGG